LERLPLTIIITSVSFENQKFGGQKIFHMAKHLKFYGCPRCRSGMHTKSGGTTVQKVIRRARRSAKQKLKQGKEPDPKVSVDYTD
jgi:hypothetical protein